MLMMFTLTSAAIFIFLAALHGYWALGGRWGLDGVLPSKPQSTQTVFQPTAFATLLVAAALASAALLVLEHTGFIQLGLPLWLTRAGIWTLCVVFTLRAIGDFRYVGFFKRVRDTIFARRDSLIYSPLCLLLAFLSFYVAMS